MTATRHTPLPFGGPLTSAAMESPLSQLDTAIVAEEAARAAAIVVEGAARAAETARATAIENIMIAGAAGGWTTVPAEVVDARGGYATLGSRFTAAVGGLYDRTDGLLGVGATAEARNPFKVFAEIAGPDAIASGTVNIVGLEIEPYVSGDFTGIGGADPGFAWGMDLYCTMGAIGLSDYNGLNSEVSVTASGYAMNSIRAAEVKVRWVGAGAAGSSSSVEGLRIIAPTCDSGAVAGNQTIGTVYGLIIEDFSTAPIGTNKFGLYVSGGISRFDGQIQANAGINAATGILTLMANSGGNNGAQLELDPDAASDGSATFGLHKAGAVLQIYNRASPSFPFVVTKEGSMTLGLGLGVWGHAAPVSQPAAPTTLANVIAILQGMGACA